MCAEGGGDCQLEGNSTLKYLLSFMHIGACEHKDFVIVPLTSILKGLSVPPSTHS